MSRVRLRDVNLSYELSNHCVVDEAKIWHNMEFHHFGLILSALFGLIAVFMSWYLIFMHCTHYLKPWEQKQSVSSPLP